ncbi:MAG: hypothetical protein A2747_02750 [Candidatus Yonathbacteria bacterium RIFCSPHIGHO2_01_FULL_44_41]|uniref:Uncharacterized protein n=1 Tax=Candidatus Yonathbacteria bacterium RIFCSPHIGHO2_02_FULL_44_14 TaxID=1802724 RepID=A0A1G2S644_9BACT|nr:MAG: hypothetical protein A2747_02750 [Candidatus Yonathbacteria bacterium RIFCSPHIGHO2_01_FULL_44_41]OHA80570.1 MAG: hypothetical protein A3D51_00640 [Candidatus Yonathbacteria bacterium RIFCSPHIGHO2_02_FULL_44_14]OHA82138.1 MAG: hypothetical protein A3B06_01355 [Candidatus Yonathbacteria bacterium RIFCSPLOWO2_01_FULL_43_20]
METQSPPLVCPSHTAQYIGVLVVGIIVGTCASFIYFKQVSANTYQAGFDNAKKLAQESNIGRAFRAPDDIRTISGAVTAVNGDRITVHTQSTNPFEDPAMLDRTIVITKDTKIIKISQGDMNTYKAERDAYIKNMKAGKSSGATLPRPPEPILTTIDASSITVGIALVATATENIKTLKEFSASEIQIH